MWAYQRNGHSSNGVMVNHISENGAQRPDGIQKKKFIQVPKLEPIGSRKLNSNNGLVPNGTWTSRSNKCQLNGNIFKPEAGGLKNLEESSVEERFKGLKIYEVRSHWDSSSEHSNASTSSSGVQKQVKVPVLQKRGSVSSVRSSTSNIIGLSNQHFQVKQVTPDGFVQIQPLLSSVSSHQESYQLDDLQFFHQTSLLSATLKNWGWNRPSYTVTFGTSKTMKIQQLSVQGNQGSFVQQNQQQFEQRNPQQFEQENQQQFQQENQEQLKNKNQEQFEQKNPTQKTPNSIRLYQEYPHGGVYTNRQIQLELRRQLTSSYHKYFNEARLTKVVKVSENGNIWLQVFPEFQDRILNLTDNVPLPEPIGLLELLKKSPSDLKNQLYLIPFQGSFRRIQIQQIIYPQKKLLVKFIDIGGDPEEIRADFIYDCYQLDPNLANFPPLVIKCHIKGIVSLDVEEFDTESSSYFVQFVDQVTENVDFVREVHLWDEKKRYVNGLVVENGTAVPEPHDDAELLDWYSSPLLREDHYYTT